MGNQVHVNENLCKGCDICVEFCPKEVFEASAEVGPRGYFVPVAVRPQDCSACMLCEHLCPELAITVMVEKKRKKKAGKA